jgi:hypothetical protein
MKYYIGQTPSNSLSRFVAALVATVCLLGAFFFGLIILAVVAVAIAVFSLVFWVRLLWLRRSASTEQARTNSTQPGRRTTSGPGNSSNHKVQEIIEGEYTVVSERRD